MELIIQPAEFPQTIEFNNEELKNELSLALDKYKGLTYTDDTIKIAKADKAHLNKFKDAIEAKRKEIKAKCLAPYQAFEVKVAELTAMIDEPITEIDQQIKAFEDKRALSKKADLMIYFEGAAKSLPCEIEFERIFDKRWLNVSYPLKTACEEISEVIYRIATDFNTIAALKSPFYLTLCDRYKETFNMSEVLALRARLEKREEELVSARQPEMQQEAEKKPVEEANENDVAKSYDFRVWLTGAQKTALVSFLKSNNIKYGKVN